MNKEIFQILKKTIGSPPKVLHEPYLDLNDEKEVLRSVRSTFVSTVGKHVNHLENELKKILKSKYVLCLNSGTSALHISLKLLGANERTEIMMPSLTYVASANSVIYNKADPYFIDVNEDDYGINPETIKNEIKKNFIKKGKILFNKKTKKKLIAIMPVHVFGIPSNMREITKIAKKYSLAIIEDAADSLGSKYKNKHTGTFGKIGVLSFNGNKTVTAGGGGAIVGNDKETMDRVRHLTTTARRGPQYLHDMVGFNYRMTNIQAAVGCAQMEELDRLVAKKRAIADTYNTAWADLENVTGFAQTDACESADWFSGAYLEEWDAEALDKLRAALRDDGIDCREFWMPTHLQPPYADCFKAATHITDHVWQRVITLPCSTSLTDEQQDTVISSFKAAFWKFHPNISKV